MPSREKNFASVVAGNNTDSGFLSTLSLPVIQPGGEVSNYQPIKNNTLKASFNQNRTALKTLLDLKYAYRYNIIVSDKDQEDEKWLIVMIYP